VSLTSEAHLLVRRLRDDVGAEVIDPADVGYEAARAVFFPQVDRRPAAIVRLVAQVVSHA
jgi:hypothetical protein